MRTRAVPIDYIDRENFLRYGEVVEVQRPDPGRAQRGEDEYKMLTRSPSPGWRVALHCVRTRYTDALYSHDSRRLLTPQRGATLLCVAPAGRPEEVQVFLLDVAVVVNAEVPHRLLTLSADSWVQVAENFETTSRGHRLRKTLVPAGIWD